MIVDEIMQNLHKAYVPMPWHDARRTKINKEMVSDWCSKTRLTREALYDSIALILAKGFQSGEFDFLFCDHVVNDLHTIIDLRNDSHPEFFYNVFLAFDEGEYYHAHDGTVDPVEKYTRPQIADILRKYFTNR